MNQIMVKYETELREEGVYSEMEIQGRLEEKKLLDFKINYTLDKIPNNITAEERIIYKLIHESANDKNSSTFREEITLCISGYENSPGKLGYDGFVRGTNRQIEVKPQNSTDGKKLNGNGQFTDFTHARFLKHKDDDILMVVSGFHNGQLKFIVEFDFNSHDFTTTIESHLMRALPNGDEQGKYCRSASFGWNKWKEANNLKLLYLSDNINHDMFSRPFLTFLQSLEPRHRADSELFLNFIQSLLPPSPKANSDLTRRAVYNFENFKGMSHGTASLDQVMASSAGVSGWAAVGPLPTENT